MNKNEAIETRTAKIWLDEEDILRYDILPGVEITLPDTEEYVKIHSGITKGKKLRLFTDLRRIKSITREARVSLSKGEAAKLVTASALLIGSPVSKMIGNFFMGINKPAYPTKLFTSEEKALDWLKGFVNEEK